MPARPEGEKRQARLVAIVLVATALLWLFAQWALGGRPIAPRWVFLVDFAALGAFAWALIVTLRLRAARRNGER